MIYCKYNWFFNAFQGSFFPTTLLLPGKAGGGLLSCTFRTVVLGVYFALGNLNIRQARHGAPGNLADDLPGCSSGHWRPAQKCFDLVDQAFEDDFFAGVSGEKQKEAGAVLERVVGP